MKTFGFLLIAVALLQGCRSNSNDLSPNNPQLVPPTPVPLLCPAGPLLFEDFESGTPLNPVGYGGGLAPASSWDSSQSVSPVHSWRLVVTSTGYGAGINISSNYGLMNASCKTVLKFEIRADTTISYTVRFRENGSAAAQEDENWVSPSQSVTGNNTWATVAIPLATFTEDAYGNPLCSGICDQAGHGNNTQDLGQLKKFEIQFAAGATGANYYLDDIRYE